MNIKRIATAQTISLQEAIKGKTLSTAPLSGVPDECFLFQSFFYDSPIFDSQADYYKLLSEMEQKGVSACLNYRLTNSNVIAFTGGTILRKSRETHVATLVLEDSIKAEVDDIKGKTVKAINTIYGCFYFFPIMYKAKEKGRIDVFFSVNTYSFVNKAKPDNFQIVNLSEKQVLNLHEKPWFEANAYHVRQAGEMAYFVNVKFLDQIN